MPSQPPLLPVIRDLIRASGPITFHRYMELCLYHPQHGYYNSGRVRLGAAGDFYTSAHVTPVFARILARHFQRTWVLLGRPSTFDLVEMGPGDGLLASELLSRIGQRFPELAACLRYTAMEQSAHLRCRLEESLKHLGSRFKIVENLTAGTEGELQGCVFANEFFDSLPFHLLVWRDGRWRERYVSLRGDQLQWNEGEPSTPDLAQEADLRFAPGMELPEVESQEGESKDGWVAEISPQAGTWIERISGCLRRGEILLIDYGYTLEEWQRGRFPQGSALGYRKHQAVYDLLSSPGEQDLTAHVNFSQLTAAGERCGLRVRGLQSQASFLMELGQEDEFGEVFADCDSETERRRRSQLLKTLILPQGMGEAFRVLRMEKGV